MGDLFGDLHRLAEAALKDVSHRTKTTPVRASKVSSIGLIPIRHTGRHKLHGLQSAMKCLFDSTPPTLISDSEFFSFSVSSLVVAEDHLSASSSTLLSTPLPEHEAKAETRQPLTKKRRLRKRALEDKEEVDEASSTFYISREEVKRASTASLLFLKASSSASTDNGKGEEKKRKEQKEENEKEEVEMEEEEAEKGEEGEHTGRELGAKGEAVFKKGKGGRSGKEAEGPLFWVVNPVTGRAVRFYMYCGQPFVSVPDIMKLLGKRGTMPENLRRLLDDEEEKEEKEKKADKVHDRSRRNSWDLSPSMNGAQVGVGAKSKCCNALHVKSYKGDKEYSQQYRLHFRNRQFSLFVKVDPVMCDYLDHLKPEPPGRAKPLSDWLRHCILATLCRRPSHPFLVGDCATLFSTPSSSSTSESKSPQRPPPRRLLTDRRESLPPSTFYWQLSDSPLSSVKETALFLTDLAAPT